MEVRGTGVLRWMFRRVMNEAVAHYLKTCGRHGNTSPEKREQLKHPAEDSQDENHEVVPPR